MSFIVRIAKNIWPRLFVNKRATIDRATYLKDSLNSPMTDSKGEVLTDSSA